MKYIQEICYSQVGILVIKLSKEAGVSRT